MSDLTVVMVSGPRAAHVMALVGTWCSAGLADESIWVMVEDVERDEGGIARVPAVLLSPDGPQHGELFELVGARRIDVLRLVAAQLVTPDGRPEIGYLSDVRGIAELVRMAVPLRVANHADGGTQILRVNLIIGESKVEGLALDHLIASWDVNAVVAAEDRPDVDRSNVFVRSRNFPPHAAAAIASVGGLWAGVPAGALDHLQSDASSTNSDVVVVRPSVRILVGDGPSERILKEAMNLLTQDEMGPAPLLPWALPAADPVYLAGRAAAFLLQRDDWRDARDAVPAAPPSRPSAGPTGRAVPPASVNPYSVPGTRPAKVPQPAWTAMPSDDWLARGASPAAPAPPSADRAERGGAPVLGNPYSVPGARPARVPQPAWTALRPDDVPLPASRPARVEARSDAPPCPVWELPSGVGDDLPNVWSLLRLGVTLAVSKGRSGGASSGSAPVGSPEAMAALAGVRLREHQRLLSADVAAIQDSPIPPPAPATWRGLRQICFALVDGGTLPDGFPVPRTGGNRELAPPWAVAPDPEDQLWPISRRDAHVIRDPLEARVLEVEGEKAIALQEWLTRRRRSITWRLAENLADRMTALDQESAGDRRRGAGLAAPDTAPLVAAQARLRLRWRVAGAVLAALALLIGIGALTGAWLLHPVSLLVALAVPLLAAALAHRRYVRALLEYQRAVDERIVLRRASEITRAKARRERARLGVLYAGLTEWSEILGRVIHRPWYPGGNQTLDLPDGIVESFPAAVGVAVPKSRDSARERRLAAYAVPIVCRPGWSALGFAHLAEAVDQRLEDSGDLIAADFDVHDGPLSPRRRLLEACRGGEAGVVLPGPAIERVEDAVLEGLLDPPETLVQRIGRFSDGQSLPDSDFFSASLSSVTPFSLEQWSPVGLQRGRHLPDSTVAWLPHIEKDLRRDGLALRRSAGSVAMRIDISRRCEPADLVLFGEALDGANRRQRREVQGRHTLVQEGAQEWV